VDGEEDLDPDNPSSVLNTFLNTINIEFDHESLDVAVTLLNADPIDQSTDNHVPGQKYSIPGLPRTRFLAHQVWAIGFIVRRWALVADEMGLAKCFTLVAAAMVCQLVTEKVVMGLPLSISWGNTLVEWVYLAQNNFPGIISDQKEWYLSWSQCSVPRYPFGIQSTPPLGIQRLHQHLNQSWW
jgi:hypothetical protein